MPLKQHNKEADKQAIREDIRVASKQVRFKRDEEVIVTIPPRRLYANPQELLGQAEYGKLLDNRKPQQRQQIEDRIIGQTEEFDYIDEVNGTEVLVRVPQRQLSYGAGINSFSNKPLKHGDIVQTPDGANEQVLFNDDGSWQKQPL